VNRLGSAASPPGVFRRTAALGAALLITAGILSGFASAPPTSVDLRQAFFNPQAYHNERVELIGYVVDYEPAGGDTYRTLHFTLGLGPDEKVAVFGSGYTADAIAKASGMVGEAFEERGPVSVIGKLEVAGGPDGAGAELRLESVEYKGRKIHVARGRKTRPGFDVGGWRIVPSVGISTSFSP